MAAQQVVRNPGSSYVVVLPQVAYCLMVQDDCLSTSHHVCILATQKEEEEE